MRLRRVATTAATFVVALVVALTVPISQLRTITVVKACCCPDPEQCHCPDHQPDHSTQPSMRACHRTSHELVAPEAPAFTEPVVAEVSAPTRVIASPLPRLGSPHATPAPRRPDAPS